MALNYAEICEALRKMQRQRDDWEKRAKAQMNARKVKLTCWSCQHFNFTEGDPGYSEETPGWDATVSCAKGHGSLTLNSYATEAEFRALIYKANTCKDFEARTT